MSIARLYSILIMFILSFVCLGYLQPSYGQDLEEVIKDWEMRTKRMNFSLFYSTTTYTLNKDESDYRKLILELTEAIGVNPTDADAYLKRANAKEKLYDYRGAIEDYNTAINLDSTNLDSTLFMAYNNRGICKAELNDYKGAIEDFNKVIELNSNYTGGYFNKGVTYYLLGEYEKAVEVFTKVLEVNTNYYLYSTSDAFLGRAASKFELGQKDSACIDLSKAGEFGHFNAYNLIKRYCSNINY